MAYIGRDVRYGNAKVESFTSSGQTAFTLSLDTTTDGVLATLNGVVKRNGTDFNVTAGTTLTFTSTVVSGVILQVVYMGLSVGIPTPGTGTVGTATIANDAIDSQHYADGSIDLAHLSADCVDGTKIADDAINSEHYTDGSIDTAHIADNAVTGGKIAMTSDARGDILYYNGTDYARLAKGSSGTVLKMGANDPAWGTDSAVDLTADQSWTGSQRATMVTDNDGSFDMNAGQNFNCTPSGNFALTFTNIANGQSGFIILINSGGHTVTLHGNSKADANLATTVSTAGTYILNYISNGTNAYLTNSAIIA